MDNFGNVRYFSAIMDKAPNIPAWQLYGENSPFPDLLHIERIADRAAGLDWQIAPHRHLHLHQVFAVLSGEIQLWLDGRKLCPPPPVLINIPRGTVHGFAFSAGTEGFVLTLPAADFPEVFGAQADMRGGFVQAFVAPLHTEVSAGFADIARLHVRQGAHRRLRLRAATLALCCAVAEADVSDQPETVQGDSRIAQFEALIRANPAQPGPLAACARALGLSERHLRRICLSATGLSAHALVQSIRLREACRLLAYTRMQVQQIGFALGYDDPAYFARVFRRGTGVSPADYRQQLER
jgi:AraC family transcriptional regulator, transcriptional activator of pobA